jgi:hypothetical protein
MGDEWHDERRTWAHGTGDCVSRWSESRASLPRGEEAALGVGITGLVNGHHGWDTSVDSGSYLGTSKQKTREGCVCDICSRELSGFRRKK